MESLSVDFETKQSNLLFLAETAAKHRRKSSIRRIRDLLGS